MVHAVIHQSVRVLLVVAVAGLLGGCMLMHARGHGEEHAPPRASCPVCGSPLEVSERTPRATYRGKLRYFAGEEHLREFIREPARFTVRPSQGEPVAVPGGQP